MQKCAREKEGVFSTNGGKSSTAVRNSKDGAKRRERKVKNPPRQKRKKEETDDFKIPSEGKTQALSLSTKGKSDRSAPADGSPSRDGSLATWILSSGGKGGSLMTPSGKKGGRRKAAGKRGDFFPQEGHPPSHQFCRRERGRKKEKEDAK